MGGAALEWLERVRDQLGRVLTGPQGVAVLPALCMLAFWSGGENALVIVTAALTIAYFLGGAFNPVTQRLTGRANQIPKSEYAQATQNVFDQTQAKTLHSATFAIELEELDQFTDKFGKAATEKTLALLGDRLGTVLRDGDIISQLAPSTFGICLAPVRHLDLEICIQLATRIQAALEEPLSVDGTTGYVSASIGFCQENRAPSPDGNSWLEAAKTAAHAAQQRGPSTIRAFSDQMREKARHRSDLFNEVVIALEKGQIQPWFQPQISTDTGAITGFEALARWDHPEQGILTPPDFLPAIEAAQLTGRLAEVIIYHAFNALNDWDKAGVAIPKVGINFDGADLNNPKLLEKIEWELDRFNLTPDRLAVEVLETVVAGEPDDVIARNINALGKLGCWIDLDDFGTGNASIASIRRFAVNRIKIDRSFVMRADRDAEQQRMIGAILTMAERLEIETLAEGVETVGEHVMLAQLGCDHVQGFGIGKPMPFEVTLDWIARHNAKLQEVPKIMGNQRQQRS